MDTPITLLHCVGCESKYEVRPDAPVACPSCGSAAWVAVWVRRDTVPLAAAQR